MITDFPVFKLLESEDKLELEKVADFSHYSDINFTSLYIWDTKGILSVAKLYNNIVVQFSDYQTGEPFFSIFGQNNISKAVEDLMAYLHENNVPLKLKLVPEETAKLVDKQRYMVIEDPDNFDHIFSVRDLLMMHGGKYRDKRNLINKLNNKLKDTLETRLLDFDTDKKFTDECLELFKKWQATKKGVFYENEYMALKKFLNMKKSQSRFINVAVYIKGELNGLTINEKINSDYVIGHFCKALTNNSGIYPYLMHKTAYYLDTFGFSFINAEQDLGLDGLRRFKSDYGSNFYLKKYLVQPL